MKRLFIQGDTLENKISYCHIAVFFATLPFDRFYSELTLISFLVHSLINSTNQRFSRLISFRNLLASSVFLVSAIGILYSADKAEGTEYLQRQLAIVLFPFIFSISGLDLKKYRANLFILFSFTCVITVLYLYLDAIRVIRYNNLPLSALFSQNFLNHNFSQPINMHATYLSMYCMLSVTILVYYFLSEKSRRWRIIYVASSFILLAALLQLASRSVFISSIAISLLFPFMILKGTKRIKFITAIIILTTLNLAIINNIDSFKKRFFVQLKNDLSAAAINDKISDPRIARWRLTMQLIKESPFTGYGTGSEKRLLNDVYYKNKLYNSFLYELNAHNQYLSVLLKTGVWGLFIFLFTILLAVILALRNRDILFTAFLIMLCIVFFSENVLDVNKGIFFYAFFFSFFIRTATPFGQSLVSGKTNETRKTRSSTRKEKNTTVLQNNNSFVKQEPTTQ